MKIVSSWDDGSGWDMRLLDLLKKYKIQGTFYIPTINDLSTIEINSIHEEGFQIGGHTISHPEDLKRLSYEQQLNEIQGNKEYLEELIGDEVTSFCYPGGKYNEATMGIVEKVGFREARTTMVGSISEPENRFRRHTTVHVYNGRPEYKGKTWQEYGWEKFLEADRVDGYFHIWGHSLEIEHYNEWKNLEEFFRKIYDY